MKSINFPSSTSDDLIADDLFGNEAGEDEDPDVLNAYFVEKPEFAKFYSPASKFRIVRARKGIGKSALLKKSFLKEEANDTESILIYVKGSDLVALQPLDATGAHELIHGWQQRICSRVNLELGERLKLAFSDDAITLVESAELAGFKGRNIVGSLLDRLKGKVGKVELSKLTIPDPVAMLERFSSKSEHHVAIFIDDIDATFINNETEKIKISTFFSACRNLVNSVAGLIIRVSVRTDVWALLRQYDEALDKCEQYSLDLRWSNAESEAILCRKILGYFQRKYPSETYFSSLKIGPDTLVILGLVFQGKFHWGSRVVPADRPIHILSAGRPRWAAQLCKMAANVAFKQGQNKISQANIRTVMRAYSQARVDDLYREHRHQVDKMERLIEAFAGTKSRYTTLELLKLITDKIIKNGGMPHIDGVPASGGSISIAHFLYRIGFLFARDEQHQGLEFVRFEERPNLLTSTTNLDDGQQWEIHPSYRSVLRIQGSEDDLRTSNASQRK